MFNFFKVDNGYAPTRSSKPGIYLEKDMWNDFWEFQTMFDVYYVAKEQRRVYLGKVKIGKKEMDDSPLEKTNGHERLEIPQEFLYLTDDYFSVGQDSEYYKKIISLGSDIADNYFLSIKDMAYNPNIFERFQNEPVMYKSLLRDVTKASVIGQYHRIATGGAPLTPFDFSFNLKGSLSGKVDFHVNPNELPPSNIQVIIGRNGVGKSHLLKEMIESIFFKANESYFEIEKCNIQELFAGVVGISFSAFDDALPTAPVEESINSIKYRFVGVRQEDGGTRDLNDLSKDFNKSIIRIKKNKKQKRWLNAVKHLENDNVFESMEVGKIIEWDDEEMVKKFFKVKLSSGHKIVLLIITKLVDLVEEKTLILLDEPENHLHPPLLSAFTRALSELLVNRNGVAIVATHSPVVLQEVQKNSVWILSREGNISKFERPRIETFGENVGILTREVFRLELVDSGYHIYYMTILILRLIMNQY
ncbi:AAA family ATPase [Enterococcus faecium]|nr:AAA family ATPase [Enterococcus faecium]